MTNTDNNGENNENDHPPMTLEELYAEIQRLSNVETALINVRQEANDAAEQINARRLYLVGQLRQQYLNNQSATTTPQPLQIQIAAAINGNLGQDGQQENDGPKEAAASSNSPTDGNAIGSRTLRPSQREDSSSSVPQPFAQRNGNSSKIQQLSAPPILSCNQQHLQQQQQQQQEQAMIQINDEEEELEQENAMEVDGSAAENAQNEADGNVEQCQEELQVRIDEEARRRNLAEWRQILDNYFNEFGANVQNEVMPEANINVGNEDQQMGEGGQEPTAAENNQSRNEELEPSQNEQIQQINAEEDVQNEEENEHHHCECDDGHNNDQQLEEEDEDEPANENEIDGTNAGGNHQRANGKRLKRRYPGEPWCLRCLFHQQFGWYPREEYDNDPELKKRFAKYIRQRTMIAEEDEKLKEEFEQFLRQYLNHREMNGDEPFPQQKRATRGRSRSRGRNQQPNDGALENDGSGASNVQSTSNGNNNTNIAQGSPPLADANPSLNSSDDAYGNDRKKLNTNRSIPKKPGQQKAAANPPNGPSTSTTFDEILANMERMPSSSAGSNFNGRTLDQRLLQDVLPDSQPPQTNLASITEATLGQQEQNLTNEQMDANEAPQSPHLSNSDGIQQNEEMTKKKAKSSPILTVNGQQNSQPQQQSSTPQQQRNPPEQGIWMTSNFTPSPSNMADVFEFPVTSPPHIGNVAMPPATVGNGQTPQNVDERTPLGAIHPNAPNKKRRSDSPRKSGEKRAKKAEKPAAGAAALNPKYERIGGGGQRNVENLGNNGHQGGISNEGNVVQQPAVQHSSADAHPIASPPTPMSPNENVDHPSGTNQQKNVSKKKDCRKPTPKSKKGWKPTINPHGPLAKKLLGMDNAPAEQPAAAAQRENSAIDGQANEDQMRQSTSQNIQDNANSVKPPPNSPVVRQQPSVVAEANPQGILAKKSAGMNVPIKPAAAVQRQSSTNGPKIDVNANSVQSPANGPKIGGNTNFVQPPANAKPTAVRRQQAPVDPRLGVAPLVVAKNNVNGALATKSAGKETDGAPQRPAAMNGQNSSVKDGHTTLAKNANLAKKSGERAMDPPRRPAAMNGQNSSMTDAQMRQSTSRNISANVNPVHRDPGPALRDQNIIMSAMNNPKGQLAKTMGDPGAIRSLLAKPHSHKNTGNANGEKSSTAPVTHQRQNSSNDGQLRQSTSTRPSTPPSIHGQQSPPATAAESNRQQQKSPGDQKGTGGTKRVRFLFGTATPADVGASGVNNGQSTGNKPNGGNGPSNGGGNGLSNGQGTSNEQGTSTSNAIHGPTNQGRNEEKKGATVAKSGQKPAPSPADDILIPKSKFTDRSKPSAGGSRRNE